MALKDLLALVDDKLHDVFSQTKPDPVKARQPLIKAIDKAQKQFDEGKQPRGENAFWSANNGVLKVTPNVRGKVVRIGGKDFLTVPQERAPDAFKALKSAVEAGELDDQLLSDDAAQTAPAKVRKPRSDAGQGRGGWSDERRAAFNASIAARKAAKGQG